LAYPGAPSMELQHIDGVFTEDKVWTVVRGMTLDKCLYLDGFSTDYFISY
jgi:hypothetical protein